MRMGFDRGREFLELKLDSHLVLVEVELVGRDPWSLNVDTY